MKQFIIGALLFVIGLIVLLASVRGIAGNPTISELNSDMWKEKGPFELSPERGRFALTYSLLEEKSFVFPPSLARFVTPDLGYINGNFVSLFAPTVSFFVMPGYIIGKYFGISQVGTFFVISVFALLNTLLIYLIAQKIGCKKKASLISAISFLIATPAFAYAVTLYQHHISLFLILFCTYILVSYRSLWQLPLIWLSYVIGITVDYPNLFLMFPLIVFATLKIITREEIKGTYRFSINPFVVFTILPAILPILFFAWFNINSYGNPFTLSGSLQTVASIDTNGKPVFDYEINDVNTIEPENQSVLLFFNSRNLLNGLYINLFSPDRGIIWYAPLVLFMLPGAYLLYRRNPFAVSIFASVSLTTILLYSMWGDPWGGWAFGSRYLIPLYAFAALFLAEFLSQNKRSLYAFIFYSLFVYSIVINTLGALTTNRVPPKIQAESLSNISKKVEKYTYARNWDMITTGDGTKSFVYNTYFKNTLTPFEYYSFLVIFLVAFSTGIFLYPTAEMKKPAVIAKTRKRKAQ